MRLAMVGDQALRHRNVGRSVDPRHGMRKGRDFHREDVLSRFEETQLLQSFEKFVRRRRRRLETPESIEAIGI